MTATREQDSQLPAATRRAYRKARYRVFTEPPLTLRVGEPNARLARVHRQYGVTCSAFVTACNPRGEMGTDGENHARQQALAVNLDQKGHARLTGIGEDPAGEWPGEASGPLDKFGDLRMAEAFQAKAWLAGLTGRKFKSRNAGVGRFSHPLRAFPTGPVALLRLLDMAPPCPARRA